MAKILPSRLRFGPLLARPSLEEARALRQYQPMQHISPLLTIGINDYFDVSCLGKVRELILWSIRDTSCVRAGSAMAARVGTSGGDGGGAMNKWAF